MNLSVIIPTYNGLDYLNQSIPALVRSLQLLKKSSEIIIVDNGSTDKTEKKYKRPEYRLIRSESNLGFSGGANKGAAAARGENLLFLNNDCIVEKNTVTHLLSFLVAHPEFVATQPVVRDRKGAIENVGYWVDFKIGKAHPVTTTKENLINTLILQKQNIYGLSATCLLIKKTVFSEVGGFDESFHSYLEDVDLFIRLKKNGYLYYPALQASCLHYHRSTSKNMGLYKEIRDFQNWIRIIKKNYSLMDIIKNFPFLGVERLRNLSGIIKKSVSR